MQTKLTLRMEPDLIVFAKQVAKKQGKSLSALIADYLMTLEKNEPQSDSRAPLTNQLRGIVRDVKEEDYKHYLEKKYL